MVCLRGERKGLQPREEGEKKKYDHKFGGGSWRCFQMGNIHKEMAWKNVEKVGVNVGGHGNQC